MSLDVLARAWLDPVGRAAVLFVAAVLVGGVVHLGARPVLQRMVARTANTVDDVIVAAAPLALAWSALLAGLWFAIQPLALSEATLGIVASVFQTVAVAFWARAALKVAGAMLDWLAQHQRQWPLVEPRTLPLFDILARTLLIAGASYFVLLAWDIDVTAWLASAGVLGIAIGFASKDTLSNLVAGLFIIADAPYKLGDYLIIDDKTRGRVTAIGLRSTRLMTRDDVEVIVPNQVMAGSRITNESGGVVEYERVRCAVEVAYGSDLDRVREVLMAVATGIPLLLQDDPERAPRIRFRSFEAHGIRVEVLGWITKPELRGVAVDAMVVGIWRGLRDAGIEIPFPQRVVHLQPAPREEGR